MKTKPNPKPAPRPRKYPQLWQSYLFYDELVRMRTRHKNRISSAERGVSNFLPDFEELLMQSSGLLPVYEDGKKIKDLVTIWEEHMIAFGSEIPVWDWVTSIKGIGDSLAARLLAQIDDISRFSNISKLWRYSGYAVIDGERERPSKGEKLHYNKNLKSTCYLIADQFIRHRTPLYRDIYDQEKIYQRMLHPEAIKRDKPIGEITHDYTDAHLHAMALRKTIKIFLSHLWLNWRLAEGLPISNPYAIDILHHADVIVPL